MKNTKTKQPLTFSAKPAKTTQRVSRAEAREELRLMDIRRIAALEKRLEGVTKMLASGKNSTKKKSSRFVEAEGSFANIDMPFKQSAAFEQIMAATGGEEFAVAAKVISVGLFALGLDTAGDYCLAELTDALHGERSGEVFNGLSDAGGTAADARHDAEVKERQVAKAEAAGA
jgi:hypothetical protein